MARIWGNLWQCLQCVIAGVVHVNARNHLCHYRPARTGTSPQVSETIWDCWCTTATHHSWNLLVVVAHMKNTHVGCVVNKVNSFLGDTHVCRVRMHYGHSDVFDRLFHISRGGISKASKQINLSSDTFTGSKRELSAQCFLVKTQILSSKEKHLELGVELFLVSLCEFLEASLLPQYRPW